MEYDNLYTMFEDILKYVQTHPGCRITCTDDPRKRLLGFIDAESCEPLLDEIHGFPVGAYWCTNIQVIMGASVTPLEATSDIKTWMKDVFRTQTSRLNAAKALTSGRLPWDPDST
jgi:hypothetical protein